MGSPGTPTNCVWTNERAYALWTEEKLNSSSSVSMRVIGGACFPSTVVLSAKYREIVERTTIALSLNQRDLDIQNTLNVLREAIEKAKSRRRLLPPHGPVTIGPLGRITWIVDDGVPLSASTFAATARGLLLIFVESEFHFDEDFWPEYWICRSRLLNDLR